MLTKFICLANSFKEGGRCLAGIEVDSNNNPIILNGRPKWIRPVCNTPHGEVPNNIAERLQILNIVELEVTANQPYGHQSENVTFDENSIKATGSFNLNNLANLCDTPDAILGNRGSAVSQEFIHNLNHSLLLISVADFGITQRMYETRPNRPQTRLAFIYNGTQYDLPITDPAFLHIYQRNPAVLEKMNQIYLTLSLGIEWESWYYKLVATIIY